MNSNVQLLSKRWWRVPLLLLACLLGGSGGVWADSDFTSSIKVYQNKPTHAAPYFELSMIFYDWTTGSNSFWREGPEILVDNISVGRLTKLDQYNDKDENGNDGSGWGTKAAKDVDDDSQVSNDGARWWKGSDFYRDLDGVRYQVRLRNPYESCTSWNNRQFSVYMRVYISGLAVGTEHTISIRGQWIRKKNNKVDNIKWNHTFRVDDYFYDSYMPTAEMTSYNTVKVSGTLNGSLGPTKVGFYSDDSYEAPSIFVVPNNLASLREYSQGNTSFSGHTGTHNRSNNQQADGSKLAVEYLLPREDNGFTTYFYKWFTVDVPGFVKPKDLKVAENTTDMWKKRITLEWNADESNHRSKEGRWYIYRGENLLTEGGLDYSKRTFKDETPEYETDYTYKVAFVPDGTPSGKTYDKLSATIPAKLNRSWNITNFTGTLVDDDAHIKLSWTHENILDASGTNTYMLYLYRSTDNETWGSPIYSTTISSPNTTTGSYIDTDQALLSNHTYYYKLLINLLGGWDCDAPSGPITLGGSQLTGFTASRGDYSNVVKLTWTVKQVGGDENTFIVARRPLGTEGEKGWQNIYTTAGKGSSYSYDDITALTGVYSEYRVSIVDRDNHASVYGSMKTDGFTYSTGVISGRITYGTGTAVDSVKVKVKPQDSNGDVASGFRSVRFTGGGAGLSYTPTSEELQDLFGGDFTVQMYVYPDSTEMNVDGQNYIIFNLENSFEVQLRYDASRKKYRLWYNSTAGGWLSGVYLSPNEWNHVSYIFHRDTGLVDMFRITAAGATQWSTSKKVLQVPTSGKIVVGNTASLNRGFRGCIDEFRFFKRALSETEILTSRDHTLAGTEDGLAIYYPFDEGLSPQTIAYDYSKTNGIANGHHAESEVAVYSSTNVPNEEQLSLMTYTDVNGNYTIRGVPFTGEGTAYSIIPEYNIHEFSPSAQSRFVSQSSLVHSGVDFEDVSSFPLSGRVYYSGTDYPVEGVNFYIDGVICSKNGEMVTTNAEGEYTISVPIGKHFIEARKNGHVFVNNGRFPPDPNNTGNLHTFDRELNMDFRDTTLVNFTGRVVGGDIEGEKPVGFGKSINNIGVTELVLKPLNEVPRMNVVRVSNGSVIQDLTNQKTVPIASATNNINSKSWRGAGDDSEARKLYIRTDSLTGEFSAMLPPIEYKVASMKLVYDENHKDVGEPLTIDLTNPLLEYSDTLYYDNDSYTLYSYNTILRHVYHSEPQFIVTQEDHDDGAFGISEYKILDELGVLTIDDIYKIENGKPVYKYGQDEKGVGAAVFEMSESYTFKLKAYEEYTNNDGKQRNEQPKTAIVPLSGLVVTIDNALSDQQPVYIEDGTVDGVDVTAGQVSELQSNQLKLDSLGEYTYKWTAGLPNISAPYTRTISMTYDINGVPYQALSGMKGVVLGSLPTGNNFVTSGPDMLDMILRDPPGTGSSAEWSEGVVVSKSTANMGTWNNDTHLTTTSKLGVTLTTVTGMGVAKVDAIESKSDLEVGILINIEGEAGNTWSRTVETTKTISTSDDPGFVGAQGDVFIGSATNVIFGKARDVGFHRIGDSDKVQLELKDIITNGISFGTEFAYTQAYIENVLIPNLIALRNSKLRYVSSLDGLTNNGKYPIYYTTILPDEPGFGENNPTKKIQMGPFEYEEPNSDGSSYKMVIPDGKENECFQDSVYWCNNQIKIWKDYLALNEQLKAEAYENREDPTKVKSYTNYSFDAGSSIENSIETETTTGMKYEVQAAVGVHLNRAWGVAINKTGVIFDVGTETKAGYHREEESSTSRKNSFKYTLKEEGSDALTVDVYDYDAYGPIFRTRGGQTCNPYEGEVLAQYYKDDKGNYPVLMEATMQIEVPTIEVDVPIVSDIPTGSAANYTVRLGNQSEIGEDVAYRLFMLDETNPHGAQISIDGKVLTEGRLIKVPGNQTLTKTLQLRQTDTSILEYLGSEDPNYDHYREGIGIVFASDSQPEDIADTIFIKAYFVPSSSPVTLQLSSTVINTTLGTNPNLVLTFKDFDRNYHNLKAFRLQYKEPGNTDWTLLKEYVLNAADKKDNNELLPNTGATVSYTKPMSSFTDGNYLFRCVSVATYGIGEVYRYSDEIALVKDMQKPRPIGQPEPTDGILDIGDDISIVFNEDVIKGEITKKANFLVTGVLNGAELAHETALSMNGGSPAVAAAQTEASINLADKDFSIDAWVNINGSGTLLSHGQGSNKLTVGTDASDKLVVNIADSIYTSTNAVPKNDWAFLTMNVTTDGKLNATVATANETVKLFTNQDVVAYAGNGPLAVGCGSDAVIHELLLWDEAHDMTTALLNRSKSKSPSTRHLIGYWKMDEGEGTSIRDYARSRNMTMTDETWYLNNENKAVSLDGSHYLGINTSQLNIFQDDDYAVEFWMRGDKQTGEAQLMQMGDIALSLTADGQLQLTGKNAAAPAEASPIATTSDNLADNVWHHVALNVLRQGAAAVYVDGTRVLTTNTDNVGGINGDKLLLGARRTYDVAHGNIENYTYDNAFKGEVDEVRVWGATMNGDQLAKNRKVRFTGSEPGLIAYYPFETKGVNDYSMVVTLTTTKDLTGSGLSAELYSFDAQPSTVNYVDDAPALHTKPAETNVNFNFVASDNKVVINIDEDPATIEGCTLNFSIHSVRDLNGNYSEDAIWSAFVNQKELVWQEDAVSCATTATNGASITATIVNKGGKQQMWTLSGMPSWLQASSEYGTTNPLEETKVTFTVSPSTPIGKYEETVYLKDNNGIETPLTINVKVKGEEPIWAVNVGDFEESMNIISSLYVLDQISEDEDDLVGAFINGECRGVARPVYHQRYDSYFVTMDVYGRSAVYDSQGNVEDPGDSNDAIEFKVYDASTGIIYPVVKVYTVNNQQPTDIKFASDNLLGRFTEPLKLDATDEVEQNIELGEGWNWTSFAVKPDVFTVKNVFEKAEGKVPFLKSRNAQAELSQTGWVSTIKSMNNREMYAVQTSEAMTLSVTGHRVASDTIPITVNNGWSWVAFNSLSVMSLADALADMQPQNDEIIKGQRGVAYYDQYEWVGSLKQLTPGKGYKIQGKEARTFHYPVKASVVSASRQIENGLMNVENEAASSQSSIFNSQSSIFTPVDYRSYPANMVLIAQVACDGLPVAGVELGVFAGDECREAAFTDQNGMVFITIPGDEPCELTFRVATDNALTASNGSPVGTPITYETDAIIGSPRAPFVIDLGQATGISEQRTANSQQPAAFYDLQGRKVTGQWSTVNGKLRKGVYITNGHKTVK